jgi:hypothetical protein
VIEKSIEKSFELDIEVVEKEPKETPCARLASFALGES